MPEFVVTQGCYVPVGGGVKFKPAGVTVNLDEKDAKSLKGYVEPVRGDEAPRSHAGQAVVQPVRVDNQAEDTPNQSDTKDVWVDFAESKGIPRDKAEALTKVELVEKFGPK